MKKLLASLFYRIIHSDAYQKLDNRERTSIIDGFKKIGLRSSLPSVAIVKNPQYISIGDDFASMYNLRLEAWDGYGQQRFTPEIVIGNNVILNTDVHIGCINKVVIGDNVLIASRVYISDHSHGKVEFSELSLPPTRRDLFSRGPVIIGNGVWIGEGVCVMPGVTIGENSIIGANAVVTKDIPANSVAAGIPAKVIKQLV